MEMSLNLIIFLVIGLTVLGVVISFVTGFIGDVEVPVPGEDDGPKLREVLNKPENLAVLTTGKDIKRGEVDPIKAYVKIRNVNLGNNEIFDGGEIGSEGIFQVVFTDGYGGPGCDSNLAAFTSPISLAAGKESSYLVEIRPTQEIGVGTCFVTFNLKVDENANIETQVLTLNIN